MRNNTGASTQMAYARVAGLIYVITILLGFFSASYVGSTLIIPGNIPATINNILNNELLYRIGAACKILLYALVVLLAFALYVVLKPVNPNLARLALLWRVGEAVLGAAVSIISGLIPLLLINNSTGLAAEEMQALTGLFLGMGSAGLDVVLIFIGMGGTIFCYLFFISKYVPRILAGWGILTYLSMLVLSFASILAPGISDSVKMIFYAPGGLFELLFGFWLLIKGVKIQDTAIT